MRKPIAIATIAGSLLGGTAVGALAFGPPGTSGADAGLLAQADPDDTTATDETTDPATDEPVVVEDPAAPEVVEVERGDFLADTLAPLVEAGTITQAQADAVIAALEEARPERGHHVVFPQFDEAATVLGITADELRTELEAGKTIATIASEQGVDLQTVIDALVADGNERIDEAVTAGRLTAEEATEAKATLTENVTAFVNGELPDIKGPGRPHGPFGSGGWDVFGD